MSDTLSNACAKCNVNQIQQHLEKKKIPTVRDLMAVLKYCSYNTYDKEIIINMFVDYGYNLSYKEFLETLKYKIKIRSIDKFNFVYDDAFYELCAEYYFYPYADKEIDKFKMLLFACKSSSRLYEDINLIRTLIKNGVRPNIDCLIFSCNKYTNNYEIIKLILSKGIVPNIECLKLCTTFKNKKIIEMVTTQYSDMHDNYAHVFNIPDNAIEQSGNKKYNMTPTMITFYNNNMPLEFETKKTFSKVKSNIEYYIKINKLETRHKLSFKINGILSCFGIIQNKVIQNINMDDFILHIMTYLNNNDNDNDGD